MSARPMINHTIVLNFRAKYLYKRKIDGEFDVRVEQVIILITLKGGYARRG